MYKRHVIDIDGAASAPTSPAGKEMLRTQQHGKWEADEGGCIGSSVIADSNVGSAIRPTPNAFRSASLRVQSWINTVSRADAESGFSATISVGEQKFSSSRPALNARATFQYPRRRSGPYRSPSPPNDRCGSNWWRCRCWVVEVALLSWRQAAHELHPCRDKHLTPCARAHAPRHRRFDPAQNEIVRRGRVRR